MKEDLQLKIEIVPGDSSKTADIAKKLERELGKEAAVELSTRQETGVVTRSGDTGLLMPIINVTLFALQTGIFLAMLLRDIKKEKLGTSFTITNPLTGKSERILETDSFRDIKKKIRKVLKRKGAKVLFLGR